MHLFIFQKPQMMRTIPVDRIRIHYRPYWANIYRIMEIRIWSSCDESYNTIINFWTLRDSSYMEMEVVKILQFGDLEAISGFIRDIGCERFRKIGQHFWIIHCFSKIV